MAILDSFMKYEFKIFYIIKEGHCFQSGLDLQNWWMSRSWRYRWFKTAHVTTVCARLRKNVQIILSDPSTKVKTFSKVSNHLFFKALDKGSQWYTKKKTENPSACPRGTAAGRDRHASHRDGDMERMEGSAYVLR